MIGLHTHTHHVKFESHRHAPQKSFLASPSVLASALASVLASALAPELGAAAVFGAALDRVTSMMLRPPKAPMMMESSSGQNGPITGAIGSKNEKRR